MGFKSISIAATAFVLSTGVNAGTVTGGSLLSGADANQLETWLGVGDTNFTNIWAGNTGATSTSWHEAVDGVSDTISIYNITYEGSQYLLGGYSSNAFDSVSGWTQDGDAFIFNLSTSIKFEKTNDFYGDPDPYAVYNDSGYFATFGGGYDLYGGTAVIEQGYVNGGYSYDNGIQACGSRGENLLGTCSRTYFTVNALETYTYTSAVPIPSAVWLFSSGIIGLISVARKKA